MRPCLAICELLPWTFCPAIESSLAEGSIRRGCVQAQAEMESTLQSFTQQTEALAEEHALQQTKVRSLTLQSAAVLSCLVPCQQHPATGQALIVALMCAAPG